MSVLDPVDNARSGSASARRAVEILFAFSGENPRQSAKNIAVLLGIPLPSVHRYIALLREMGLIVDDAKGLYQLTPRVLQLGRAALATNVLLGLAHPYLVDLSTALDETVILVQLHGDTPVCVDRVEPSRNLRLSFQPGQSLPPLQGASIKVLLGGLSPGERRNYAVRVAPGGTDWADFARWESEAAVAGERGYTTSSEEIDEGVWTAAAAIKDGNRIVATISVPCPAFRHTEGTRQKVLDAVRAAARDISAVLHAPGR